MSERSVAACGFASSIATTVQPGVRQVRMFLFDVSIKRPVFATMMMVALVVLGIVSYQRLAIDEYPDLTYPVVIVNTTYPGASPEVMVREVSKPVEEAVNTVQGIREVTSTSLEGASIVRVLFNLGVDVDLARQD